MKNKKMLYLMHINWDWIYQRPQIMSKKLEKYLDVLTVYEQRIQFRNKNVKLNKERPTKYNKYYILPKSNKFDILDKGSMLIEKLCSIRDKASKADILWFCYPSLLRYLNPNYCGIVIYDCMDDHIAMAKDARQIEKVEKSEKILLKRADIVFVSSNTLLQKLIARGLDSDKAIILRNGCEDVIWSHPVTNGYKKDQYHIGYIGTIAEWFDYNLIEEGADEFPLIKYHLIGPKVDNKSNNYKKNIHFEGRVDHELLYEYIKNYDCLIMPFIVNDIVSAVDPVKLYEYISYGKCIISVYYPEIERFSDFVYFYRDENEFREILRIKIEDGFLPKYNAEQQEAFLKDNTWDARAKEVINRLKRVKL